MMEEAKSKRYLVVDVLNGGRMSEEVNHSSGNAGKVVSAVMSRWKRKHMTRVAKVGLYKGGVQPALLHESEVQMLSIQECRRAKSVEIR